MFDNVYFDIVSLEIAKLAKEKGFDFLEPCTCGGYPECICEEVRESSKEYIYRPPAVLLQEWLRKKHQLDIEVTVYTRPDYGVVIIDPTGTVRYIENPNAKKNEDKFPFSTYEEALKEGLKQALILIP